MAEDRDARIHDVTAQPPPLVVDQTDQTAFVVDALLHLPDGIVVVDGAGTVLWANHSAERIFEWPLDEWIGASGLDLIHPDDQEYVLRALTSVQAKDVGTPIELRIKSVSGWRLVEVVGTTIDRAGAPVIVLCMRDLTERRRFEIAQGQDARIRSLVHNAASVIFLVSSEGVLQSVSGAITRLLGHDPEVLEQRPMTDIVARRDRTAFEEALGSARRSAHSGHPITGRIRFTRFGAPGTVPMELSIVNLLDDPTVEGLVISAHDATAQEAAERALGEMLSLLSATLDSTTEGILVLDGEGQIVRFNRRFSEIWRIPDQILTEQGTAAVLGFAAQQLAQPEVFLAKVQERRSNPEIETFDTLEFKDGRVVERYTRPQWVGGEVVGGVLSFRDVTERTRLEDELTYRAFHDSLTGLANKALFQDRLDHALARIQRSGDRLAILFVDLDDFKTVNDSLGHGEGDQLLKRVAGTLVRGLRPLDTAARLGGDEFAVLIEDVGTPDEVTALADRILEALRPAVQLATNSVHAAGSIGIAFSEPGITSDQLLRNADIAMYKAKELGKDRFEVYREEMHASVLARIELEHDLRAAVLDADLVAHYQPIIDLVSRRIEGFEALVRWTHPQGGLIDPRHFVPLAEELGIVGDIDAFVLRSACEQARHWQDSGLAGPDLIMSVNVSARELVDPSLADRIAAQLDESDFDPRALILEITESTVLTDNEVTMANLAALRSRGVRIALDDFGTGYSSFSHLARLQIDIVKIDRSFVQVLNGDDDRSLAAAMVQLARTLGYDTIAEGVEKETQAQSLRLLGCRLAQGYHLGRPLDAQAATEVLARNTPDPQAVDHLA